MNNGIVSGGTPKQTFNSAEADYQQRKTQTIAQSGQNSYIQGVQTGVDDVLSTGPGQAISDSRTEYGAPRLTVGSMLQGDKSNFAARDTAANQPLEDPLNTSGNADNGVSSTIDPEKDSEVIQEDALEKRLALYSGKMGGADMGNNDRSKTMRA